MSDMSGINNIPTALLLIGYGYQDPVQWANFQHLAFRLTERLNRLVIPCPLDQSLSPSLSRSLSLSKGNPILGGIRRGIQQGVVKFVALPLFLSLAEYRENAIAEAITWASRRWPFLTFHLSPPLDWARWTRIFVAQLSKEQDRGENLSETGILLVGQGGEGREVRGDLAKLGRLLFEASGAKWLELAFVEQARPDLATAMQQMLAVGVKQVILQPAFLFGGTHRAKIFEIISDFSDVQCHLGSTVDQGELLLDLLAQQYTNTLQDDTLLPVSWDEVRREIEVRNPSHQPKRDGIAALGTPRPSDEGQFDDLTERINAILPPRYQNGVQVSAAPMTSAGLQFNEDGTIAWDAMWGLDDPESPFCELALAGGPPHRGTLLEAARGDDCLAEPSKYAAVLAELQRGIRLVTGLSTVSSPVAGWIGLQCATQEMAIWLLRAIIVENVMVRREGTVLYLPASPHFTLAGEIKNVVTVVAKTVHYWTEHSRQRGF